MERPDNAVADVGAHRGRVWATILSAVWVALVAFNVAPPGATRPHEELTRAIHETGVVIFGVVAVVVAVALAVAYFVAVPWRLVAIETTLPLWWTFAAAFLVAGGLYLAGGICAALAIGAVLMYANPPRRGYR